MKLKISIVILLCLGVILLPSCNNYRDTGGRKPWIRLKKRLDLVEEVPYCMEKKIRFMQKYNEPEDYTGVWRWLMENGDIYYYVYSERHSCDDCLHYIYNTDCEKVCAPTGGLRGRGSGTCNDDLASFNYKERVLIWKSFDF